MFATILLAVLAGCGKDNPTDHGPDETPFSRDTTESFYLTMSDGVRLAVDLTIPEPLGDGGRVPTIIAMTRYWRADQDGGGHSVHWDWRKRAAARRGYAFLIIDERGTGASFGVWPHPWPESSFDDFAAVVDWVVAQDWSDGQVAPYGISYLGMAAQRMAAYGHPAVKAAVPAFTQYDLYTDIAYPGGIFNDTYVRSWHEENELLDRNLMPGRQVKAVDADTNGSLRAAAASEHAANGNTYEGFREVEYRDRVSPLLGVSADDISAHTRRAALEQYGVPLYHWGSWLDQANSHAGLTRFLTLDLPQVAVIGPWEHGGFAHATPYGPSGQDPDPSQEEQWNQVLAFLDSNLGIGGVPTSGKVLHYYTYGAEEWRTTDVWPVAGTTMESWYFEADNTLVPSPPDTQEGSDLYAVDFTATTGEHTRWDGGVDYPDRRFEDLKLLTYTTAPLVEDTEITGYPVVTLILRSTHSDGGFFVYLEDVDPNGRVTYLTEGELRGIHRKISTETPPFELVIPYHSFKEQDAEPLIPGEIAEISFGLLPISVVIRAGHRIRVAVAGHDAGWFARVPEVGNPVITVMRNQAHPSGISLPVVRQ